MRNRYRFTSPPATLRKTRLDNVALVPASILGQIARYQEIANALPAGGVLIVVPSGSPKQRTMLSAMARALTNHGHHVRLICPAQHR